MVKFVGGETKRNVRYGKPIASLSLMHPSTACFFFFFYQ